MRDELDKKLSKSKLGKQLAEIMVEAQYKLIDALKNNKDWDFKKEPKITFYSETYKYEKQPFFKLTLEIDDKGKKC